MRTLLWPLVGTLLLAPLCITQQPPAPAPPQQTAQDTSAPPRELTSEENKTIAAAEKQRKKFPDWLMVLETQNYSIAPQAIGYVGWCGGNLSWIFCMSAPISSGGGERVLHRIRLESTGQEMIVVCGTFTRWVAIFPGKYPAKKRVWGLMDVLVNLDGKMKKVTCRRL